MSREQAKSLMERMKSDPAFNARILAVENLEERLVAIQAAGFDCSERDIADASKELEELADIDHIAAGGRGNHGVSKEEVYSIADTCRIGDQHYMGAIPQTYFDFVRSHTC